MVTRRNIPLHPTQKWFTSSPKILVADICLFSNASVVEFFIVLGFKADGSRFPSTAFLIRSNQASAKDGGEVCPPIFLYKENRDAQRHCLSVYKVVVFL